MVEEIKRNFEIEQEINRIKKELNSIRENIEILEKEFNKKYDATEKKYNEILLKYQEKVREIFNRYLIRKLKEYRSSISIEFDKDGIGIILKGNLVISDSTIPQVLDLVKKIEGKIKLTNATIVEITNLEEINGDIIMPSAQEIILSKLKKINGSIIIESAQILEAENLEYINGNLYDGRLSIVNLNKLEKIGGSMNISSLKMGRFPNLRSIEGNLEISSLSGNNIDSFEKLEYVGGNINFGINGEYIHFNAIKDIGGNVIINSKNKKIKEITKLALYWKNKKILRGNIIIE